MDLEVQVERRSLRIARVTDEAEDIARVDDRAVHRERRIRGEVGVIELVAAIVAQPKPAAARTLPADGEHDAVRDREDGRAERREEVVTVVPAPGDVRPRSTERVAERDGAVHREHISALAEM